MGPGSAGTVMFTSRRGVSAVRWTWREDDADEQHTIAGSAEHV